MVWVRDRKNPKKDTWVVGVPPSGVPPGNKSRLQLPSIRRSAVSGPRSSTLSRPRSGVGLVNSHGPEEMSKSEGKKREVTPPTPPESPEPSKSSTGKRAASPDLASLAFVGEEFVPFSKRNAGPRLPRAVPC